MPISSESSPASSPDGATERAWWWPLYRLAFWAGVAVIAYLAVVLHRAAALTLPAPWGDESYFIWPARAWERWNTLVAPEILPDRPILLLPVTYSALLGTIFKVTGYSLETARLSSLAFLFIGVGCLIDIVRRRRMALASLALIAAFVLGGYFVSMGNVARMEALFFAMLSVSLLLFDRGRNWTALAVLSITPMIHPNGMLYFWLPVGLYAFVGRQIHRQPIERPALVIFAVSFAIWLANGIYTLIYWDGFIHDTAHRLGETSAAHGGLTHTIQAAATGLAGILATAALATWWRARIGHLMAFAVGAWCASRLREEQWYEAIGNFGYLLQAIGLVLIVAHLVDRERFTRRRWLAPVLAGVVTVAVLGVHLRLGRIDGPVSYIPDVRVAGMRFADPGVPYFSADDRRALESLIDGVRPGCRITVEMYPWGDGLLMGDYDERRVQFQVPYFDPFFQPPEKWVWGYQPNEWPVPDLYILRYSRYQPALLNTRRDRLFDHMKRRAGGADPVLVRSRDTSEIWYAFPASDAIRRGETATPCRPQ